MPSDDGETKTKSVVLRRLLPFEVGQLALHHVAVGNGPLLFDDSTPGSRLPFLVLAGYQLWARTSQEPHPGRLRDRYVTWLTAGLSFYYMSLFTLQLDSKVDDERALN